MKRSGRPCTANCSGRQIRQSNDCKATESAFGVCQWDTSPRNGNQILTFSSWRRLVSSRLLSHRLAWHPLPRPFKAPLRRQSSVKLVKSKKRILQQVSADRGGSSTLHYIHFFTSVNPRTFLETSLTSTTMLTPEFLEFNVSTIEGTTSVKKGSTLRVFLRQPSGQQKHLQSFAVSRGI